jgi:serine/threonine protein kinase
MHRDISPGNIIIYEGRANLSDLEFAKQYESGTSNNIRTVSQPPQIFGSSFDFLL